MHFSLPLPKSLILLSLLQHISFAAPAAEPIPAPAPIPVLGARNNSPITLPYFSSGAALEIKSGETRVYYQSEDGAIHELSGFNSPDSGNAYTDNIILPAGEARKGTPLAVTDLTLTFVIVSFSALFSDAFLLPSPLISSSMANQTNQSQIIAPLLHSS